MEDRKEGDRNAWCHVHLGWPSHTAKTNLELLTDIHRGSLMKNFRSHEADKNINNLKDQTLI